MLPQPQELRKIAEGREAEMYAWGDGTILRLLRSAVDEGKLQREALAMEAARSSGVRVPAVHDLTTVIGRPRMVMERIDGPDLLALVSLLLCGCVGVGNPGGHSRGNPW